MGNQLGARRSDDGARELDALRREVLELRIQNARLLSIIEQRGQLVGWNGSYVHEPTGVRVFVSTESKEL